MAKVKAPCFGFEARGQLGKALVYFPWKGVPCVREYVIPTNPKTAAQTTQRNRMTAAVSEFHAANFTAGDLSAWARFAGTLAKVMTGFNAFCRAHLNENILGNTWQRIDEVTIANIQDDQFEIECKVTPGAGVCTVHYGTRRTFFPDTQAMDDIGGQARGTTLSSLTASTLYYFYITHGTSGADYGRTGIFQAKTLAA